MIFIIPFPQMLHTITTAIATNAIIQLAEQLEIAVLERVKPIEIIIGPVTTGGKNFITRPAPKTLNKIAITT